MARRVNTRFLTILTLVVVGGLVAVFVAQRYLSRKDPAKFEALGDELLAQNDLERAAQHYRYAFSLNPRDPKLLVKLGDVLKLIGQQKMEFQGEDLQAWNQALQVDPNYEPALRRLLEAFWDQAQHFPSAGNLQMVKEFAEKLARVKPDDIPARSYPHFATIAGWERGLQTDPADIDAALTALTALMQEDPSNADLPWHIARIHIKRAQEAAMVRDRQKAGEERDAALAVFDQVLEQQPSNAHMHWRAAQTAMRATSAIIATSHQDLQQQIRALRDRALPHMEKARSLVEENDPHYVEIHLYAARQMMASGNRAEAEKICRALLERGTNDVQVRLVLARILSLDAARRDEAIQLLTPPVDPMSVAYARLNATGLRRLELERVFDLTSLRIAKAATLAAGDERTALMKDIRDGLQRAEQLQFGEDPGVLVLQARLANLEGNTIAEVQALARADELNTKADRFDIQTKYMLAQAYIRSGQTAAAERELAAVVRANPAAVEQRMLLAQLLIQRGERDEARKHLEALEQVAADRPEALAALRLQLMDRTADPAKVEEYYTQMPEQTVPQRLLKANVARQLNKPEDELRLLESAVQETPVNEQAMQRLLSIYIQNDQRDKAQATLAAARQRDPENDALRRMEGQLAGMSPRQVAESETDPFDRAMALAQVAAQENNLEEHLRYLKEAEKIKPDDPTLLARLFTYHVRQRQWDEATQYAQKLGASENDASGGLLPRLRLALAKGDFNEAVELGRQLTDRLPQFAASWLAHGQALQMAGRYEEAMTRFQTALTYQADNFDAIRGIIECYEALGQARESREFIEKQLRSHPRNAYLGEQLVVWMLMHGTMEEVARAVDVRQQMLQQAPDNPQMYLVTGFAHRRAAAKQVEAGNEMGARASLESARQVYAAGRDKWPDERVFWVNLVDLALLTDQPQEAERLLKEFASRARWKDSPEPLLMLADVYARTRRLQQAETALRDALAKSNNHVDVQRRLAQFLFETGRVDDALAALDLANASNPIIQRMRIDILILANRLAEAEKLIRQRLASEPDNELWRPLLASVLMNSRKLEEAGKLLDEALQRNPRNAVALELRGRLRLRGPKPDLAGAIQDLSAVRDLNRQNLQARMDLAEAQQRSGNLDAAMRELEALLVDAPEARDVRVRLVDLYTTARPPRWVDANRVLAQARSMPQLANDPVILHLEARVLMQQGRYTEALEPITLARKAAPADATINHTYLAILLQDRRNDQVVQEADTLLSNNPGLWWALQLRAQARHRLNDREGALADFQEALASDMAQQNPQIATALVEVMAREMGAAEALRIAEVKSADDPRWMVTAAMLHSQNNDLAQARRQSEAALAHPNLSPRDRFQALQLAASSYMQGENPDYAKSEKYYLELLKDWPDDLRALNNLAYLLTEYSNPPRPAQGRIYSQKAFDLVRSAGGFDPLIADTHGWVLLRCGDVSGSVQVLQEVIDRAPFLDAHYHLAEAYIQQERADAAQAQLQQAMSLIQRQEQENRSVNPTLKKQVEEAMQRVVSLRANAGANGQ